ncbi:hypothetical protein NDN08_004256 [Rhodosorus marinus]|uniref:Uncharacterized protein n=1 Tax=Rhodosorus marinus TaxID=101924 RepID=A0AAV8UM92_9RHOD|nr:hypothetical protein NDN08_004256 [Rhodosorus marinus]
MESLGLGFVNGLSGVSEKKRLRSRISVSTESSRRGLELSWNYQEKRNDKPLDTERYNARNAAVGACELLGFNTSRSSGCLELVECNLGCEE